MVTRRLFLGAIAAVLSPLQPAKKWVYIKLRRNSLYGKLTGYGAYGKVAIHGHVGEKKYYGAGSEAARIIREMRLRRGEVLYMDTDSLVTVTNSRKEQS